MQYVLNMSQYQDMHLCLKCHFSMGDDNFNSWLPQLSYQSARGITSKLNLGMYRNKKITIRICPPRWYRYVKSLVLAQGLNVDFRYPECNYGYPKLKAQYTWMEKVTSFLLGRMTFGISEMTVPPRKNVIMDIRNIVLTRKNWIIDI